MSRKLIAANWKMNGSLAQCRELLPPLASVARDSLPLVVCPPACYLPTVAALAADSALQVGAQDAAQHDAGAYTGEMSAAMLRELGCQYAIVGHSERRHGLGETDDMVAAKAAACLRHGLTPIICIGETQAQYEAGQTADVVERQVKAVLARVVAEDLVKTVFAYEPVWAIGTGLAATPEQAQAVHASIRALLTQAGGGEAAKRVPVLYGGSVKAGNAASLFAMPDIDGALVGGASLVAAEMVAIYQAGLNTFQLD
ncbi:triosephosphate isomerase [Chitinivorax tropicus]|uniref:Triosephosphate isomerase n=1 Tax=Chitinivorax tropicus TaxID=714531 RepID=A0A840MT30_9PROT|nr:triose-phosphate isomerase [Chitinivorax tropicus]MBB5018371.1 triosephosphate isomerase [Chitinivorax tropicus]